MSASSALHRQAASAPYIDLNRQEEPPTGLDLQNVEQSIHQGSYTSWPRRMLALVPGWGLLTGTEQRAGLAPPVTAQPRTRSRNPITALQAMIIEGAKGGQNKDIVSSTPVVCTAIVTFMFGAVLSFGNSTAIALWLQVLWFISFGLWVWFYSIFMTSGALAKMRNGRRKWIASLTVIFTLLILRLLESSLVLPSIAGITTLSTAAATWIQDLF